MKKIFVLLFAVLLLITMSACGKNIDRSQFDEGEKMDAEESAQYAADNIGNPYAQSEIGIQRAYRNLAVIYGNYDIGKIIFIPPAVSYSHNIIGVSTFNGEMTISYHNITTLQHSYSEKDLLES